LTCDSGSPDYTWLNDSSVMTLDASDQLTGATHTIIEDESYQYDASGNRVTSAATGSTAWAAAIRRETGKTCSIATVKKTQLWQKTIKVTGRGKAKGKMPKMVAFEGAGLCTLGALQDAMQKHGTWWAKNTGVSGRLRQKIVDVFNAYLMEVCRQAPEAA
jgi:YD repeat-containing protein